LKKENLEPTLKAWFERDSAKLQFGEIFKSNGLIVPNGDFSELQRGLNPLIYNYLIKPQQHVMKGKKEVWEQNPYNQNITLSNIEYKNWRVVQKEYQQYEIEVVGFHGEGHVMIPKMIYHNEPISYYSMEKNGVVWMSNTLSEFGTMERSIPKMKGNVLVLGIGLGYIAYRLSLLEQVESIVLVDYDEDVIYIFETYILPQFSRKEKFKIVKAEGMSYFKKHLDEFDSIYIDLWEGTTLQGMNMYIDAKKESYRTGKVIEFWIEEMFQEQILQLYRQSLIFMSTGQFLIPWNLFPKAILNTIERTWGKLTEYPKSKSSLKLLQSQPNLFIRTFVEQHVGGF
jgi:hypothetical protein